ncbi:hypothetical protein SAMN05660472_00698 [Natronincola ferrireducens]|uniref:Uncharacterized protein n=1 Tax=Natronincola ferrireducens TaxID=393762 RepID=A0A1G8Z2B4_9FIRM|nr:hypothetical protein SAMN05660472_00698 [Natronincola ferrireducens]
MISKCIEEYHTSFNMKKYKIRKVLKEFSVAFDALRFYEKNSDDKISLSIPSKPFDIVKKVGYKLNWDIICQYILEYK